MQFRHGNTVVLVISKDRIVKVGMLKICSKMSRCYTSKHTTSNLYMTSQFIRTVSQIFIWSSTVLNETPYKKDTLDNASVAVQCF